MMTKVERMTKMRERSERIKKEYNAVVIPNKSTPYVVEIDGINGYWSRQIFHFKDAKDAERFCINEYPDRKARVIKMVEVNPHEVKQELVFEK